MSASRFIPSPLSARRTSRRSRSTRRCAGPGARRTSSRRCRLARTSTSISATTSTSASSTRSSGNPGEDQTMTEAATTSVAPKPKKSVALSGVTAGNTALCTVGRTGNDLHYRGYDILDIAERCEFEEIAYLLVHGKLPNAAELTGYKRKLMALRGVPAGVKRILESIPANTHPMDVMRTACSALGAVLPEADDHKLAPARDIADRLMASFGSMLLYWHHYSFSGRRIEVETDDDSIGGHFLHLLHGRKPSELWVRSMHTSLNLYAEHEFNASTFTARVIAGTGSDLY